MTPAFQAAISRRSAAIPGFLVGLSLTWKK